MEQEEAFQTLKDNLCNAPIWSLPDGSEDFVVYCDVKSKIWMCIDAKRQGEASKVENAPAEMLRGLDQQMEKKEDRDCVGEATRYEYGLSSSN
ncbi:putative reverse transcriptase domain-containing protein [Tanacetum coccineum]